MAKTTKVFEHARKSLISNIYTPEAKSLNISVIIIK